MVSRLIIIRNHQVSLNDIKIVLSFLTPKTPAKVDCSVGGGGGGRRYSSNSLIIPNVLKLALISKPPGSMLCYFWDHTVSVSLGSECYIIHNTSVKWRSPHLDANPGTSKIGYHTILARYKFSFRHVPPLAVICIKWNTVAWSASNLPTYRLYSLTWLRHCAYGEVWQVAGKWLALHRVSEGGRSIVTKAITSARPTFLNSIGISTKSTAHSAENGQVQT
jgi:hypothetical protein